MHPIWLLALASSGNDDISHSTPKRVHSSWPMGLPHVNDGTGDLLHPDKFDKSQSTATMSCDDDVVVPMGSTPKETNLYSINGLYMATACNAEFLTPDGQVYELVQMNRSGSNLPILISTRASSSDPNKRYERNGNVLDIVNVTHRNLNETGNNQWSKITNLLLNTPSTGNPYLHLPGFKSTKTCVIRRPGTFISKKSPPDKKPTSPDEDGELLDGFGYLPFWASDNIDVPFCYYKYSADKTNSADKEMFNDTKSNLLFPDSREPLTQTLNPARDRRFYSTPKNGFGTLMNMRAPSCSDSSNTMCMPGRCSMLDTNYLFRESSKEHVFKFASMGTYDASSNTTTKASNDPSQLQQQIWAVVVLGRSQCDPMYGGGIVHTKTPDEVKFPAGDRFNTTMWTRLSNDGDAFIYTTDPFEDKLFMNERGTISGLPTYAFEQWGKNKNPNPKWWFKSEGDYEDGDPSGIRTFKEFPEFRTPKCTDFLNTAPINDDVFKALSDELKNATCHVPASVSDPSCPTRSTITPPKTIWGGDQSQYLDSLSYAYASSNNIRPAFVLQYDVIKSLREELSGTGNTEVPLFEINPDQGIAGINRNALMQMADILVAPLIYADVTQRKPSGILNNVNDDFFVEGLFACKIVDVSQDESSEKYAPKTCDDADNLMGKGITCDPTGEPVSSSCAFRKTNPYFTSTNPFSSGDNCNQLRVCRPSNNPEPQRPNIYTPMESKRQITFAWPMSDQTTQSQITESSYALDDFVCEINRGKSGDAIKIYEYHNGELQEKYGFIANPHIINISMADKIYCNDGSIDNDFPKFHDNGCKKFPCTKTVDEQLKDLFTSGQTCSTSPIFKMMEINLYKNHIYRYKLEIPIDTSFCFNRMTYYETDTVLSDLNMKSGNYPLNLTITGISHKTFVFDKPAFLDHPLFTQGPNPEIGTITLDKSRLRQGHAFLQNAISDLIGGITTSSFWDSIFDNTERFDNTQNSYSGFTRIKNAIPSYYRLDASGANDTNPRFTDWYDVSDNEDPDTFFDWFDRNYTSNITAWASNQHCPIFAGCILRPKFPLSATHDGESRVYAPAGQLECRSFWASATVISNSETKNIFAEDPGLPVVSDNIKILNRRYKATPQSGWAKIPPNVQEASSEHIILDPFVILPPEVGKSLLLLLCVSLCNFLLTLNACGQVRPSTILNSSQFSQPNSRKTLAIPNHLRVSAVAEKESSSFMLQRHLKIWAHRSHFKTPPTNSCKARPILFRTRPISRIILGIGCMRTDGSSSLEMRRLSESRLCRTRSIILYTSETFFGIQP